MGGGYGDGCWRMLIETQLKITDSWAESLFNARNLDVLQTVELVRSDEELRNEGILTSRKPTRRSFVLFPYIPFFFFSFFFSFFF